MSLKILEQTANDIGMGGFLHAALEGVKEGDPNIVACTATSLLMSIRPRNFGITINDEGDNEFAIYFTSDTTKEFYEFRLPIDESIKEKADAVKKLFGVLSLELAFKSAKVAHAERVQ